MAMNELNVTGIARKAWKSAPLGESEVKGTRVVKDSKMVIVTKTVALNPAISVSDLLRIVAFPRPEHAVAFGNAEGTLKYGGPASHNPRAIGTAEFSLRSRSQAGTNPEIAALLKEVPANVTSVADLAHAQAHYTTTGQNARLHKRIVREEALLPRSLATYYGGWRLRALREAMLDAQRNGRVIIAEKRLVTGAKPIREVLNREGTAVALREAAARVLKAIRRAPRSQLERDLRQAAKEAGATIKENRKYFAIIPGGRKGTA